MSELLSLDGVAEDPDKFLTDWDDDVMDANMSTVIDTQDAVILGRRSYDEWARFCPDSHHRTICNIHQRGREIRCDVYPARPGMGEYACRRGRSDRVRP